MMTQEKIDQAERAMHVAFERFLADPSAETWREHCRCGARYLALVNCGGR